MTQFSIHDRPDYEPPEHPDEIRAREEAMLLLYGGHSGLCSGPGCDCGWYQVTKGLPRLPVAERDRRLAPLVVERTRKPSHPDCPLHGYLLADEGCECASLFGESEAAEVEKPGYYYEHVNGSIHYKPFVVVDMGGGPGEYFDSPMVRRWWRVDP